MSSRPLSRVETLIGPASMQGDGFNDFMRKFYARYNMPLEELEKMLDIDYILDNRGEAIQDYLGRSIKGE